MKLYLRHHNQIIANPTLDITKTHPIGEQGAVETTLYLPGVFAAWTLGAHAELRQAGSLQGISAAQGTGVEPDAGRDDLGPDSMPGRQGADGKVDGMGFPAP